MSHRERYLREMGVPDDFRCALDGQEVLRAAEHVRQQHPELSELEAGARAEARLIARRWLLEKAKSKAEPAPLLPPSMSVSVNLGSVEFWLKVLAALLLLILLCTATKAFAQIDVIQFQDNTGTSVGTVAAPYKFKAGSNCSLAKSGSVVTFNCTGGAGTVTHTGGSLVPITKPLIYGAGAGDIAADTVAQTDGAGNATFASITTAGTGADKFTAITDVQAAATVGYGSGSFWYSSTLAGFFKMYDGSALHSLAYLDSNITGTAANLSGTPALPNGTTATTQAAASNDTKLATDAYVDRAVAAQMVTASITYYVCTKAAAGTCVYNGDGGTVATASDGGACTTKAAPCATIAGAVAKFAHKPLAPGVIVTVQESDDLDTGTDCHTPLNVLLDNPTIGGSVGIFAATNPTTLEAMDYPNSYVLIQGNTTTPGNVVLQGGAACGAVTTASGHNHAFTVRGRTNVIFRGLTYKYYLDLYNDCALSALCLFETINGTGTNLIQQQLVGVRDNGVAAAGGTFSLTNMGMVGTYNGGVFYPKTALGGGSGTFMTVTCSMSAGAACFLSDLWGAINLEGATITCSGTGAWDCLLAEQNGLIQMPGDVTTALTVNGASGRYSHAFSGGRIFDSCGGSSTTCTFTACATFATVDGAGSVISTGSGINCGGAGTTITGNGQLVILTSSTKVSYSAAADVVSLGGVANKNSGLKTLSGGTGTVTLVGFVNAPVAICTDTTANVSVKCSATTSTLTITGTGSDVIAYAVFGNPI